MAFMAADGSLPLGNTVEGFTEYLQAKAANMTVAEYRQAQRDSSAYKNSAAGKVDASIAKSDKSQADAYQQNTAFARLVQDMGDRHWFGNQSAADYKQTIGLLNGIPQKGIDENGKEVIKRESPMAALQEKARVIAQKLANPTADTNTNDLRNQLALLAQQQDYVAQRQTGFFRDLQSGTRVPDKGILPTDLIKGMKDNPGADPIDAAIIAHKQSKKLPLGIFDRGELPSSSTEILQAKSELRKDLEIFGHDPAILERASQLKELQPIIETAEEAARQMAAKKAEWEHQSEEKIKAAKLDFFMSAMKLKLQKGLFGNVAPPGGSQ